MSKNLMFSDNFETGDFTKWDYMGGAWSVQSITKHNGTYAAKCAATADYELSKTLNLGGKLYLDFYILMSSTSGTKYILDPIDDLGGNMLPLVCQGGHFRYQNSTGAIVNLPTDTIYAANTWYHCEVIIDFILSSLSWIINGSSKGSAVLSDSDTVLLGPSNSIVDLVLSGSSAGSVVYIDDLLVYQDLTVVKTYNLNTYQIALANLHMFSYNGISMGLAKVTRYFYDISCPFLFKNKQKGVSFGIYLSSTPTKHRVKKPINTMFI